MSSNPSFFNASQSPSGAGSSPEELYSYPENYTPLVHANSHLENHGIFDQGIDFEGLELTYLMESQLDSVAYLRESYEECYAGCLELVIAHDRRTMPDSRAIFAYSANKGWKPITDYDTPLPRQFISINSPEFAEHAENAIIELLSILNTVLSEEGLTWGNFYYPSPDLAIRDSVMQAYYPLKNYNAQYHQALAMGTSCFAVKTNSISNDIQPTPVDQLINPHKQWLIANLSADFYEEEADDGLDVESSFN